LKNKVEVIYCDCFQTFVEGENFFEKDAGKFLAKILSRVSVYVTCTQIVLKYHKFLLMGEGGRSGENSY